MISATVCFAWRRCCMLGLEKDRYGITARSNYASEIDSSSSMLSV